MPTLKLTLTFIDGSEEVITTKLWRCTADEIAFERRYGFTFTSRIDVAAFQRLRAAAGAFPDDDVETAATVALGAIPREDREAIQGMRTEWNAFFGWRCWCRAQTAAGKVTEDFDSFVDRLAAMDISTDADAVDPTATTPAHSGG